MKMPKSPNQTQGGQALSAAQSVLLNLRGAIITSELKPGQVIQETEIATRFGVSKTPVREALQSLQAEGFVTVFPRRGYAVRQVGFNDIRDIMDLRLMIEPSITATAARRRTDGFVAELREILRSQFDETLDLSHRLEAASDFHRAIASVAGNDRAERLLNTYFDETTRLHYLFDGASRHVVSEEELRAHQLILNAIESKNESQAMAAMIAHLDESNEALLRSFY